MGVTLNIYECMSEQRFIGDPFQKIKIRQQCILGKNPLLFLLIQWDYLHWCNLMESGPLLGLLICKMGRKTPPNPYPYED